MFFGCYFAIAVPAVFTTFFSVVFSVSIQTLLCMFNQCVHKTVYVVIISQIIIVLADDPLLPHSHPRCACDAHYRLSVVRLLKLGTRWEVRAGLEKTSQIALIMTQLYLGKMERKKKSMTRSGSVQIPSWPSLYLQQWGKSTFALHPANMDLCKKTLNFLEFILFENDILMVRLVHVFYV